MKSTLLLLPIVVLSAHANADNRWFSSDPFIINAESHQIIADSLTSTNKVTAILNNDIAARFVNQELLLKPEYVIFYSEPDCQGSAYIPTQNHNDSLVLDGYRIAKGTYGGDQLVVPVDATVHEIMHKSTYFAQEEQCSSFSNHKEEEVHLAEFIPITEFSQLTNQNGDVQFNGASSYQTTWDPEFQDLYPSTSRTLKLYVNKRGEVPYLVNETGTPMAKGSIFVNHAKTGVYDVNLPTNIMEANLDYEKVIVQCSTNTGSQSSSARYFAGCYKVNGQPIIRVITNNVNHNPDDAPFSLTINW